MTVRHAIWIVLIALGLQILWGAIYPDIPSVTERIISDLNQTKQLLGHEGRHAAEKVAMEVRRITMSEIPENRKVSASIESVAIRGSIVAQTWPLGILLVAVGAANGWATRRIRREKLAHESALLYRLGHCLLATAVGGFLLYATSPAIIDPRLAASSLWFCSASACYLILAYFKKHV